MRHICICFLVLTVGALDFASRGRAQDKPASGSASSSAPTAGPRAEFQEEIAYCEQRYTRLAEAIPG